MTLQIGLVQRNLQQIENLPEEKAVSPESVITLYAHNVLAEAEALREEYWGDWSQGVAALSAGIITWSIEHYGLGIGKLAAIPLAYYVSGVWFYQHTTDVDHLTNKAFYSIDRVYTNMANAITARNANTIANKLPQVERALNDAGFLPYQAQALVKMLGNACNETLAAKVDTYPKNRQLLRRVNKG